MHVYTCVDDEKPKKAKSWLSKPKSQKEQAERFRKGEGEGSEDNVSCHLILILAYNKTPGTRIFFSSLLLSRLLGNKLEYFWMTLETYKTESFRKAPWVFFICQSQVFNKKQSFSSYTRLCDATPWANWVELLLVGKNELERVF